MRKVIAAMNMTLDGVCDHTVGIPSLEIHQHYADLANNSGTALYGRITYQLMEYWPTVIKNPTGIKATDDFAVAIDNIPKIVFSHTLKSTGWDTAKLATRSLKEEVASLKQQPGKDILACSPSLIVQLTNLDLVDEYQICIHPVIAGKGLLLFKDINERILLKLTKTKSFDFGGVILYYEPAGE
jgi:dihydrofolate reductase